MNTSYKILMEIIKTRMNEKLERENKYESTQMGFRGQ